MYIFSFKNDKHRYMERYSGSWSYRRYHKQLTSIHGQFALRYLNSKIKKENYKIVPWGSEKTTQFLSAQDKYNTPLMGHWITTEDPAIALYLRLGIEEMVNHRSKLKFAGSYSVDLDELNERFAESRKKMDELSTERHEIRTKIHSSRHLMSVLSNTNTTNIREKYPDLYDSAVNAYSKENNIVAELSVAEDRLVKELQSMSNSYYNIIEEYKTVI